MNTEIVDNSDKIAYLQMVQGNIERMSTASAIFKGFAATIAAGISALSFKELHTMVLVMSFVPVISFMLLDLYYLKLERQYRYLYEEIRNNRKEINFDLKLIKMDKCEKCKSRTHFFELMKSPSILLFYPILFIVGITIITLRVRGII